MFPSQFHIIHPNPISGYIIHVFGESFHIFPRFYLLKSLVSANISREICEGEAETSHAEPRRQAVQKNGDFTKIIEDRSRVGLTKLNSFCSFLDTKNQAKSWPDFFFFSAIKLLCSTRRACQCGESLWSWGSDI